MAIHAGLRLARAGTQVGVLLCTLLLSVGLITVLVMAYLRRDDDGAVLPVLCLACACPVSPLIHFFGQIRCQALASRTPGAQLITTSCILSALSLIGAIWLFATDSPVLGATAFVVLNLAAFGFWLGFLARLGALLGDDDLKTALRSFVRWFVFGVAQMATLLAAAYFAARTKWETVAVSFLLVTIAIGFYLLWRYSVLLRVAILVVARRAPVRFGS
jgi:hypothetical protein